jgi:hypothetical protein
MRTLQSWVCRCLLAAVLLCGGMVAYADAETITFSDLSRDLGLGPQTLLDGKTYKGVTFDNTTWLVSDPRFTQDGWGVTTAEDINDENGNAGLGFIFNPGSRGSTVFLDLVNINQASPLVTVLSVEGIGCQLPTGTLGCLLRERVFSVPVGGETPITITTEDPFIPIRELEVFSGTFTSPGLPAQVGVDRITFGVVPEVSTWAMMLVGFAGLCIAGYRASRKSSAVAA